VDHIECAVVDSRVGVVLQLGIERGLIIPGCRMAVCYEILGTTKDWDVFLGTT
jgi:hypothetical protein